MRIVVSAVHADHVELFAYNEDDDFKLFLPISLDDAELLGKMFLEARKVAKAVNE